MPDREAKPILNKESSWWAYREKPEKEENADRETALGDKLLRRRKPGYGRGYR